MHYILCKFGKLPVIPVFFSHIGYHYYSKTIIFYLCGRLGEYLRIGFNKILITHVAEIRFIFTIYLEIKIRRASKKHVKALVFNMLINIFTVIAYP